jgi:hypothetical protein
MTQQNGMRTATATRNGVGTYALNWPSTGALTSYVQLTCAAFNDNPRFVNYLNLGLTGCNVFITTATGTNSDVDFNIRVDAAGA